MPDLPDSRPFTWILIGLWWPAPPTQPAAAIGFWSAQMEVKQREAEGVNNRITLLGQRNSGHTAEDMLTRLRLGRKHLLDIANQCRAKSEANKAVAKAIDDLRASLTSIAKSGNDEIGKILKKNEDELVKVGEINSVIWNANSQARDAASTATTSIVDATQQMFDETGVDANSRDWLQENGAALDVPPPRQPLTPDEVARAQSYDGGQGGGLGTDGPQRTADDGVNGRDGGKGASDSNGLPVPGSGAGSGADGGGGGFGGADNTAGNAGSDVGHAGVGNADSAGAGNAGAGNGGGGVSSAGVAGTSNAAGSTNGSKAASGFGSAGGGSGSAAAGNGGGGSAAAGNGGGGGQAGVNGGGGSASAGNGGGGQPGSGGGNGGSVGGSPSVAGGGSGGGGVGGIPGGGGSGGGLGGTSPLASSMPGLGGGSGAGATPQSLQGGGLSQAFASGTPGGPAGPGGPGGPPPFAQGGPGSAGFGQSSGPQVPPSPSVTPMAGGTLGNLGSLAGTSPEVAPTASTPGATMPTPTAAPPMTAGPTSVPSAPISAGPAAPSGPLPGYGADLRPAGAVAPGAPTPAAGPSGPASPSAPGGATTPTSGSTTVASSGDRPVPGKPTSGTGGQSGASIAGRMGAGGMAGAGAGTAAKRMAEQDDVQRKVDAVARQAPNLAWAAGLRDDETTTVLVTDLAGGWVPPGVLLPPGVTLLAPAQRRHDVSVVDLLGAVIATATHQPNTYVAEAGPNDPLPGAGERARYGQHIDELGPTLIDAVGASTRLPRIVQTVGRAVARRSGVADNEIERFRNVVTDTANKVLSAYPDQLARDVADWMLLAAIDALIDGSEELARYHLAWHQVVTAARHVA